MGLDFRNVERYQSDQEHIHIIVWYTGFNISIVVLEAGIGVGNQNWALTSTLTHYRFKNPIGLKLELTFHC